MTFNSLTYVIFFSIVFILYWLLPHCFRKYLLFITSYYFYMSWSAKGLVLIFFTTIISYVAAIILERTEDKLKKKKIVIIALFFCLVILFIFKYMNFVLETISLVAAMVSLPIHLVTINLILPVGISFYTFQTLSYVIDVYRNKIRAEKNFITYATFISFFPQLVAGPIERSENLLPQIKAKHYFNESKALDGAKLMIWGYYKKLVIADFVAPYVDQVYANLSSYTGFDLVLTIFLFTIQIYCDFSGYSDIAIGTAKLLDIDLMTNFKSPYLSASIKEFWSRWHISLSMWFKDYIYIPLGGNRCSKLKHCRNLFVTFLLSGLWHGANWTFVIWGGMHGGGQIIENILIKFVRPFRNSKVGHLISVFAVFLFCNVAWVFFRADRFEDVQYILVHAFDNIGDPSAYCQTTLLSMGSLMLIIIYVAILGIYDCFNYTGNTISKIASLNKIWRWIIYITIGLVVVFGSNKGVQAEFIYFQF